MRGDRLPNRNGDPTKWTFIKDIGYSENYKHRIVMVVCDCGAIETRSLSNIVNREVSGCRNCADVRPKTHPIRPGSLRQASLTVGKNPGFFSKIKTRNPERFERLLKLGKGDLADGYFVEQGVGYIKNEKEQK